MRRGGAWCFLKITGSRPEGLTEGHTRETGPYRMFWETGAQPYICTKTIPIDMNQAQKQSKTSRNPNTKQGRHSNLFLQSYAPGAMSQLLTVNTPLDRNFDLAQAL